MLKEGLDVKTNEGSFPQSTDFLMESFTLIISSPPLVTEILKMTSKRKIFVYSSVDNMSLVENTNMLLKAILFGTFAMGTKGRKELTLLLPLPWA